MELPKLASPLSEDKKAIHGLSILERFLPKRTPVKLDRVDVTFEQSKRKAAEDERRLTHSKPKLPEPGPSSCCTVDLADRLFNTLSGRIEDSQVRQEGHSARWNANSKEIEQLPKVLSFLKDYKTGVALGLCAAGTAVKFYLGEDGDEFYKEVADSAITFLKGASAVLTGYAEYESKMTEIKQADNSHHDKTLKRESAAEQQNLSEFMENITHALQGLFRMQRETSRMTQGINQVTGRGA